MTLDSVWAHRLRFLVALLMAGVSVAPVSAQRPARTGVIHGEVTDSATGVGLAGALVRVDGVSVTAVTAAEGTFQLDSLSPGSLWLEVSLTGYGRARARVGVRAGETTRVNVALVAGATPYLETVDVRPGAEPVDVAAPATRSLDASQLDALRGVLADDPFRAVHALPGVAAGDDFRSEFSVRGSDSRHLGMSVDGIAIPWPLHAVRGRSDTGSIAVINIDALDRLTLESGSYAQRSGTRTGGWIDFSVRDGSRNAFDLRAAASVTNASVLAEGPLGGGRGAWLATVRRSYLNWLLHQIDPETDAAALGFVDHQSRVVFDLSPTQQLQMTVVAGRAGYDEHDDSPGANSLRDADSHTVVVTTGVRSILGGTTLLQRVGYVSQGFANTGEFNQPLGDGRVREWIYHATSATRVSPRVLLEGSAEIRRQQESRALRSFVRQGTGVVALNEAAFVGTAWLPAVHAQVTWQAAPALVVSPGVRVAHSSLVHVSTANPWVQVLWRHRRMAVKAGAGHYPQFPEFDQVLNGAAERRPGPERATHVDLNVGTTLGGLRYQAAGYYRRERDMIRYENSEPVLVGNRAVTAEDPRYQNALIGAASGVELSVEGRVGVLSGWAAYGYGRTRYTDDVTAERFWGDYDQRHTVSVVGRYRLSNATAFGVKWRYGSNVPVGGYYENRDGTWFLTDRRNVSRFPTYSRVDLRADRVFQVRGSRVTLYAEVVNLFDRTNLGPADPSIRARTLEAVRVTETLMPRVPAVGVAVMF